jgi:hypothetical protein
MESIKLDKLSDPRREGQIAPPRPPERKPRFQIVKLEERIAPSNPGGAARSKHGSCFRSC